jgi:hypothetical protein
MRISEILSENQNCIPGWQESESIPLPLNKGLIILSYRLNKNCDVDEVLFVYHNKNIIGQDGDNEHGWIVSVKVKNGQVIVYDYFESPKGKNMGPFTTIESVKTLFDRLVQPYL